MRFFSFFFLQTLKYKLRHLPPSLVICMFTLRHLPPCLRPVTPLVPRLVSQLSLCNILKPSFKSRMNMLLEQHRQAKICSNHIWMINSFIAHKNLSHYDWKVEIYHWFYLESAIVWLGSWGTLLILNSVIGKSHNHINGNRSKIANQVLL